MPASSGKREQKLIEFFLKEYENGAWAGAHICWLDQKIDSAVEALVTRQDKIQLAIEHTLIQPFIGDKQDFATFQAAFLPIEGDASLVVPDVGITVYIPVGVLDHKKPIQRKAIVKAIHDWIRCNRLSVRESLTALPYTCSVPGMSDITLTVKCFRYQNSDPGSLLIRRQQVDNNFDQIIAKALTTKLPKLTNTRAHKRILMLEYAHIFSFDSIAGEINKQRSQFPLLAQVDQIWVAQTAEFDRGYFGFELYENDRSVAYFYFKDGQMVHRFPLN